MEFIPAGTKIGEWDDKLDLTVSMDEVLSMVPCMQDFFLRYAYREGEYYKLNADNMRYFNHSDYPNTRQDDYADWARNDIDIGEEITCNYHAFDWDADKKLGVGHA